MFRLFTCFFVQFFIFQLCLCDLALEKKEKILNSFIDYLKNLPDQPYVLRDGVLSNIIELNDNSYYLETQIKAEDSGNPSLRYVKCTGTVYDRPESGIEVANNYQCHEDAQSHIFNQFEDVVTERMSDSTVELSGRHQPIQLDNEVQTEPVSSGEQFIAVPRDRSPCIGCASQVNPEAAGVSDLALLGVNQLNVLEPSVKHSLNKVVEVERQVQVVNGIRYILTILVDYNSCADTVSETCIITKTCKISVLDKPWIRLPNGTKYRVVVSNNCTEAWLFEDHDSEHNLDKPHDSQQPTPNYNNIPNIGTIDEIIKNVHSPDVQAQPEIERTLTDEEIRNIEQQIIPNIQLKKIPHNEQPVTTAYEDTSTYRAEEVSNVESKIHVQETERNTQVPTSISEDKKKAIDDLLTFFDYAGLNKKSESDDDSLRVRRSYEKDLNFLNLAEKFNQMKKSIDNAKLLYTYAQSMVDYLNEMDIEVKNRILNHVISAEEELENNQHFFYIKALVVIPCEKVECDGKDKLAKICNSVIDGTNERSPQILTTFCYNDDSKVTNIGKINIVPSDDPILSKLANTALKHIEDQSPEFNALQIVKIISANTQKLSGTLTKLSMIIGRTNCNKTIIFTKRSNCSLLKQMGSKVCDVEILERQWLKDKSISYTCINRAIEESFSSGNVSKTRINDPDVLEILQEAIQYLNIQSNKNNKQKVVDVISVTTQLAAGLLTNIQFTVGYTVCKNDQFVDLKDCELIDNESVRNCYVQVWHRPWLEDGRQVNVSCEKAAPDINDKDTQTLRQNMRLEIREKRQVLGGEMEQNISDPKYSSMANESLQKYLQMIGSSNAHRVVSIDKVITQIVTGSLTKIDFTVGNSDTDVMKCHSEVWERSWLNKKDIDVKCNIEDRVPRKKRGIPGGVMEQNSNDPKYKALAEESLQKYLQTTGSAGIHRIVTVDKVTTQIVSGLRTVISFTVSNSNADVIKCHADVLEKSWLNKKYIDVKCNIEDRVTRKKRGVPGGVIEQNGNDPKYKTFAEESLHKYLETSGSTGVHKIVTIDKVTSQGVAGSRTEIDFTVRNINAEIIKCRSLVWERLWLNKKDINVSCHFDKNTNKQKRYVSSEPAERDVGAEEQLEIKSDNLPFKYLVSGGKVSQNANDPIYKELAENCLQKYLRESNSTQHYKIVRIKKVTTQVTSGIKTRLTFIVSPTNCKINIKGILSHDFCNIQNFENVKECTAEVISIPWKQRNNDKINHVNCFFEKYHKDKRDIFSKKLKESYKKSLSRNVGSLVEQNTTKREYNILADESLRKYQELQNSKYRQKVLEVKRVFTQVVSGTIYKIDFTAVPTVCSANVLDVSSCERFDEKTLLYCHADIWNRPWLKRKKIDISCVDYDIDDNENNIRLKRGILGGVHSKDVNRQEYIKMAELATLKFQKLSKSEYYHKIVNINHVSEQVTEGFLTTIKFSISPTTCLVKNKIVNKDDCQLQKPQATLHCLAKITDRPLIGYGLQEDDEISVKCNRNIIEKNIPNKRAIDLEVREKRQTQLNEDDIDDDTKYYYADRVLQSLNDRSNSDNLEKLITVHDVVSSIQMKTPMVRMYIETAPTYCLRHQGASDLDNCDELEGINHRLCFAKIFPSPDDELTIQRVTVVCDDEPDFRRMTGLSIPDLLTISLVYLEDSKDRKYKLVHRGEPYVVPSLHSNVPVTLSFIVASTNCSKDIDIDRENVQCFVDFSIPDKSCQSFIWMIPTTKRILHVKANCSEVTRNRMKRSPEDADLTTNIKEMVAQSLQKLEMGSQHRYKQRVLKINSYSTKITSGRVTTIDFDVGYTNCLKYEWVDNITKCEFLEHLPRRHCVSEVWERLWLHNGRNIEVNCQDDETPLEAHIEFESAETAMQLAQQALKHIEAKYPHPRKQKVVRIFSLEKQNVAGLHYRMKIEVGFTNCLALSVQENCELSNEGSLNRFCRVNVWIRPWTDHTPNYRVSCDYQSGASAELYHLLQSEQLFYNFLTTYKPDYVNDHIEMTKRFEIFKDNVKKIHELNTHEGGTATYAVTRFTDLSYDEFSTKYLGLRPNLRNPNQIPMSKAKIPEVHIPDSFDWRKFDTVTEVKDQGSCGSCWAFSVTGNIEGQWKLKTGQLLSLSEQELVDCDKLDSGCNGGYMDNAYRAIEELGGLEPEDAYPYEGEDDKCSFNKTIAQVQVSGAVNISSDETDMAKWLVRNGPISIGINANAMQFYVGGISHPWKMLCNPKNLDHGVLLVGYGIKEYPLFHKRLPYWIVKNSWGPSWGEQGYYRVYRGDGTCGVNQMASSAVL